MTKANPHSQGTGPRRRAHRTLIVLLIGLTVCAAIGVGTWLFPHNVRHHASQLQVQVIDCDLLMQDGACYPLPQATHRFLITAAPPGPLEVTIEGDPTRRAEELIIDQNQTAKRLFRIKLPREQRTHRLSVSAKGIRTHVVIRTFVPQLPDWLRTMWESRHVAAASRNLDEEISILEAHASDRERQPDIADSVRLALLARARYAKGANGSHATEILAAQEQIAQSFHHAILAAQNAQLVSEQNENVLWLSEFLSKQAGQVHQAETLMQTYRSAFASDPRKGSYYHRQRALHLALRQKRSEALAALEEALLMAQQIDDQTAALDVVMQAADVLIDQGRIETAAQWVTEKWKTQTPGTPRSSEVEGCRKQELLRTKLRIARAAMERDLHRPLPKQLGSPDALWTEFVTDAGLCQQKIWHAEMLLDWIQIQLLRSHSANDSQTLATLLAQHHTLLQESWAQPAKHHLLGLAALQSGDLQAAKLHFLALRDGRVGVSDVARWQAEIGLAHVAESQPNDSGVHEALRHYENAEAWVELAALSVPLGMGQASFLGQFESGTARHVQLLWKQRRLKESWQLLRRARTRGLRSLAMLHALGQDDRKWSGLLAQLRELRSELEQKVRAHAEAALNQQALRETEIAYTFDRLVRTLHESVQQPAREQGAAIDSFSEARSGEVMIACHPLPTDWLCLAQANHEVTAATLREADLDAVIDEDPVRSDAAQMLSDKLLRPFARQIDAAQRVTFLTYGKLRALDLHLLPFGLQHVPLIEQKQVIFASDIPSHRHQENRSIEDFRLNMNPSQYLFLNHELSAVRRERLRMEQAARRMNAAYRSNASWTWTWTRTWIKPALSALGMLGSSEGITRDLLTQEAAQVELLFMLTHAGSASADAPERYLDLGQPERFYVSDILLLPKAPRWVALFGCGTAQTDAEWSNIDSIGLAQSFLWKGSHWVLGTERTVDAALGARVAVAFYEELARVRDPFDALRFALQHAGVSLVDARHKPTHDLGSFRLYAP
ncbi:MAG: CHAT domain-containing protein [Myxococcales bacterium]|nr:CHAT domain-containing protein [Myxococcales bacterium]